MYRKDIRPTTHNSAHFPYNALTSELDYPLHIGPWKGWIGCYSVTRSRNPLQGYSQVRDFGHRFDLHHSSANSSPARRNPSNELASLTWQSRHQYSTFAHNA